MSTRRRIKKNKPQQPPVVEEKKVEPKKVVSKAPAESILDLEAWSYERQWKKKKVIPPEIPDEAA